MLTRGRLFLFYKTFWADAIPNWNKDTDRYELDTDRWWRRSWASSRESRRG